MNIVSAAKDLQPRATAPAHIALADALTEGSEALALTARMLIQNGLLPTVDGSRLLLLSGSLLAAIAETERQAVLLRAFCVQHPVPKS